MSAALTFNEFELLKQAGGKIGRPNYGDRKGISDALERLSVRGLIYRTMEDDQPTAYTTAAGDALLADLLGEPSP